MKDVMVDTETLGTSPGSVIFSIGAVAFDTETGVIDDPGFYTVVNINSSVCAGLRFDQGTIDFWGKQSDEARAALKQAYRPEAPRLNDALAAFSRYVYANGGSDARVWGNGSDFDNAMLAACYKAAGIEPGWKFWNNRCFRTLKTLRPDVSVERIGTYHHALDDAKTQAVHALRIFAAMKRDATGLESALDAIARAEVKDIIAAVDGKVIAAEDDLIG